jgi:uncharacterized membrane protein HdeD (DUF308 family)
MENRINKFDPFALILGVLFIVIAIFSIKNPLSTFRMVIIIAAIASLSTGFYKLFWIRPFLGKTTWLTLNAVLDIIVGFLMLFNDSFGMVYVSVLIALMFLGDSFTTLWLANYIRNFSHKYFVLDVFISILGIILGMVLLFSPLITAISISMMIALLFLIFGISLIIHAI